MCGWLNSSRRCRWASISASANRWNTSSVSVSIALRLAEGAGLDEDARAVVYYTALLVNVGCHSDAHEQAKWFGDDISLKSGKYDYEFRSLRAAAASLRLHRQWEPAAAPLPRGPRVRDVGTP